MKLLLLSFLLAACIPHARAGSGETIFLWPGAVPGQTDPKAPPVISDGAGRNIARIEKITDPALVVYEADPGAKNGAAVIVCPGGGYGVLAIDKEGYEIGEWLSELGYTAFVLQYRVPGNMEGALQDAQRAIRCVRGMSSRWDIDQVGFLGFSAGGSLSARVSSRYAEELYEAVDGFDALSARPDFAVLIYPAYLDKGEAHRLTPELQVNEDTPPMFLFVTGDDKHANSSLVMSSALREHKVPFELHMLPEGGHGYGMRPGKRAAETWPKLCETWMGLTVSGQSGKRHDLAAPTKPPRQ